MRRLDGMQVDCYTLGAVIEFLHLKNFRAIADMKDLRLGPGLNVLIGRNGSGKSSLIEALRFIHEAVVASVPDFVIEPDAGTATIPCDQFKQDCPPGQKCMPWADNGGSSWNATKCVEVTGDGAPGDPCSTQGGGVSGMDDCAFGSMCWDLDENNHGTCVAQCTGSAASPICPLKFICAVSSEQILILCFPDCDPLLQDCSDDELCIPTGEKNFLCVLDASGEAGQLNDPCEFANECDAGLVCSDTPDASSACDPDAPGCCQPMCKFPDAPCPNPDQQCLQLFDPRSDIPPDYKSIGVCGIPG